MGENSKNVIVERLVPKETEVLHTWRCQRLKFSIRQVDEDHISAVKRLAKLRLKELALCHSL